MDLTTCAQVHLKACMHQSPCTLASVHLYEYMRSRIVSCSQTSILARSQTEPATMVAAAPVNAHWKNQPAVGGRLSEIGARALLCVLACAHASVCMCPTFPAIGTAFSSTIVDLVGGKVGCADEATRVCSVGQAVSQQPEPARSRIIAGIRQRHSASRGRKRWPRIR